MSLVLNYITLTDTIKELSKLGRSDLVDLLLEIINDDQLPKSEKHNRKDDIHTSYFHINLDEKLRTEIRDLLFDLEAASLTDKGYPSELTSYYSDILDRWSED